MNARGKRLYQCPGCWRTGVFPSDQDWECDCGEKLTCVDLREAGAGRAVQDGLPHPECVEAYHGELLRTGRTIMSVARVQQDVADAEIGRRAVQDGLDPERLRAALVEIAEGTEPDRIGRYEYLRDWVHKTATTALRAAPPSKPVIGEVGEK